MDTFGLALLFFTVGLHCFAWCDLNASRKQNTVDVTLESFARQNRGRRFLQMTEEGNNRFSLSFTGRQGELGTKFIWRKKRTVSNVEFTLHSAGIPNYILCADDGKLVIKNSSRADVVEDNCKLEKRKVTLQYSDNSNVIEEFYEILVFQSRSRAVVKTSRSGKVSLDKWKNWKDSQAWISITDSPGRGIPYQKVGDARRKI